MRQAAMLGLGGVLLAGVGLAQDVRAGRTVAGQCRTGHRLDGVAAIPPFAPNIGGEPAAYLAAQLEAFRSGKRTHVAMSAVAGGLSDDDSRAVAEWYAGIGLEVTGP